MPLPDKEDLKCYAFIIVVILLILLSTYFYQYIVRFILLIVFYWYISIPVLIISISSVDFALRKVRIRKAYNSSNEDGLIKSNGPHKVGSTGPIDNGWIDPKMEKTDIIKLGRKVIYGKKTPNETYL